MRTRMDYERALDIIGTIVRSWDPDALLSEGAPESEFDGEIAKLATRVPHMHSAADAARAVADVFAEAFDSSFTPTSCSEVGAQLFRALSHARLTGHSKPGLPR